MMKLKPTIIFLFLSSLLYGQNVVIDISDKSPNSVENPASDIIIFEPISDTLNLSHKNTFSLVIGHSGSINSIHLIDYPTETYANLNNFKLPKTEEEYEALSDEEWAKYKVIIPKHEIVKKVYLSSKIIMEFKITSNRITHTEIYADGNLIKTLYYQFK